MPEITRNFERTLLGRLREKLNFIQVIIGPRQVGKTTAVTSLAEKWQGPKLLVSADAPTPPGPEWLNLQFDLAEQLGKDALLIIDEIQKVQNWSEVTKIRFDKMRKKRELKVVLLGSASLSLQRGLTESLAGRYEVIHATHWTLGECQRAFGWDLETYMMFGGYPAPAEFINEMERWRNFMRESIVEPVLGRDLQGMTRIDKPALFRQSFGVAMSYPAQILSLQKFLGQLQDGGNVSTVRHYLELFEGAFLLKVIPKFSLGFAKSRASSPKLLPLAPALISTFQVPNRITTDPAWRGRVFEAAVGAYLARRGGELYYWSEGKYEVDFVHQRDGEITAYEVKSGVVRSTNGLNKFRSLYPHAKLEVIDWERGRKILEDE